MRREFAAISAAFDMMPSISTTGLFDTIFTQQGSYTFTLPNLPGTIALTTDVGAEAVRAIAAEEANATAITLEIARAMSAEGANTTAIAAITAGSHITTTGAFATVFAQQGSYTFTLPNLPGTIALTTDVGTVGAGLSAEIARATTAEAANATAIAAITAGSHITTTGAFATVFAQSASLTFTLPPAAGMLALTSDVSNEVTRATAAEGANATTSSHNMGRNRVHNGGFRINQRGYTPLGGLSAGAYAHDRWFLNATGGAYSFTQHQPATVIVLAGSVTVLAQWIDPADIEGGSYVLSWIGTATGRVGPGGTGSFGASPQVITGVVSGAALLIEFIQGSGSLSQVQLEPGTVATPFEQRPYAVELAICQRFYQTFPYNIRSTAPGPANFDQTIIFPPMRATPTFAVIISATTSNVSVLSLIPSATNGLLMALTSAAAGDSYAINGLGSLSADL